MKKVPEETNRKLFIPNLAFIAFCFVIGLTGFSYVLAILPGIAESPLNSARTCITGTWKLGLIITHTLNFALIPLAMRVFYQSLKNLGFSLKAIFASQLGLAFVMVAITSEIGWHVTQCWYYQNDFTILNFMFYFFLISAFSLWSDSLNEKNTVISKVINFLFASSLLTISILYILGYEGNNSNFKIPIYITLTLIFSVLTYRGYKLLQDWKIILVPFFSIGVNLAFVFLLDKFGGNPYTNPQETFNALFHILHDLCGTEAGVAIFTWLIYKKGITSENSQEKLAIQNEL